MLLGVAGLVVYPLWGPPYIASPLEPENAMYLTGIIASGVALLAFRVLMSRIPSALSSLWYRKIITASSQNNPGTVERDTDDYADQPSIAPLEKQYSLFIIEFERWLNHWGQYVIGAFFTLLVFMWTIVKGGLPSDSG